MRSLFVMDPLDRIHVAGDSTYVTMRASTERGHDVWYCTPKELYAHNGWARALATPVRVTAQAPWFHVGEATDVGLGDFDVVWMRKDPPFDMSYIFATYLLDMVPPRTLVVNASRGLRLFNEKLWATSRFREFHPETLVTNDARALRAFVASRPGRTVLKPWDGNGGRGVLVTAAGDRNLGSMIELLTTQGRDHVIAQPYLERVDEGDKRVVLFDGEPVGAMLRIPSRDDFRGNMHVGASVEACELTERDLEICGALAPELKKWGMIFVGIDVIDGWLTEINVTSPTGLQELNRLHGLRLEGDLVDVVEAKLAAHREEA